MAAGRGTFPLEGDKRGVSGRGQEGDIHMGADSLSGWTEAYSAGGWDNRFGSIDGADDNPDDCCLTSPGEDRARRGNWGRILWLLSRLRLKGASRDFVPVVRRRPINRH